MADIDQTDRPIPVIVALAIVCALMVEEAVNQHNDARFAEVVALGEFLILCAAMIWTPRWSWVAGAAVGSVFVAAISLTGAGTPPLAGAIVVLVGFLFALVDAWRRPRR